MKSTAPEDEARSTKAAAPSATPAATPPDPPRRTTFVPAHRGRIVKSMLGGLLLSVGLYHAYQALFVYESAAATVTGSLSTLSAPISGVVRHNISGPGARIESDVEVAKISNERVDRSRLARLRAQLAALAGDLASVNEQRAGYSTLGMKFESRGLRYLERRREQLDFEVSQAIANVEAARAKESAAKAELHRQTALQKDGVSSAQAFEAATSAYAVAQQGLLVAEKEKESKLATLDGTRAGFTLDSTAPSDRTYSGQRADDLTLRLAELNALSSEKAIQQRALQEELDAEVTQIALMSDATLRLAGVHRVWEVLVESGEFVYAGRPLLSWLDCKKTHVLAYVSAGVFEHLRMGTEATIRLPHRSGEYSGQVTMLLGNKEHSELPKQAIVGRGGVGPGYAVLVSSTGLALAFSKTCEVGQAAEVRFFP